MPFSDQQPGHTNKTSTSRNIKDTYLLHLQYFHKFSRTVIPTRVTLCTLTFATYLHNYKFSFLPLSVFFFSFFGFLLKIFLPPRFFYILYFYLHQWQWQIYYMLNMCVKIIFYDAFNDPFFWKCNFMRGLLFFVVVDY